MTSSVAIIGVGSTAYRPQTPKRSYRELTYAAAVQAYKDAGVAFNEIESFVSCTEDLIEGTSIADEYSPDQMGAARKPVHTVSGNGLFGIASGVMMIQSGLFELVAVEAHSKASNIVNLDNVLIYGFDPIYERPLGVSPHTLAALDMRRYLFETKKTQEDVAWVVAKNKKNAKKNPLAAFAQEISISDVLQGEVVADPLMNSMIASHADGAIVIVLASEKKAKKLSKKPVWIKGLSWVGGPTDFSRTAWGCKSPLKQAAEKCYTMADIHNPNGEIDFVEVDECYAHYELKHLDALGIDLNHQGINTSGGSLGMGDLLEASGLARLQDVVLKLRAGAGRRALVQGWQGVGAESHALCLVQT